MDTLQRPGCRQEEQRIHRPETGILKGRRCPETLIKEIRKKLEEPKPPEETSGEQTTEELPQIDTVDMFKQKFGKILQPFNWAELKMFR